VSAIAPPRCSATSRIDSAESVVNGLGQTLRTSPGVEIELTWDFGDEARALADLNRAVEHVKARVAKVTGAGPR
jgi:hypothetical protein